MPKSTSICDSLLALIFNATAIADIAEDDTTSPLTELWVALHTGNPGIGGSQETNEVSTAVYVGYERQSIARTSVGWEIPSGGSTSNAALFQFPEAEAGSSAATISYVSIGTSDTGAGLVLYAGQLGSSRTVDEGIQPQFNENTLVVTET